MEESRVINSNKNIIYSVLFKLSNIILLYISRIIFVQILDESYLGINGLFTNILGILSLADLGIGTAMMYSLYRPVAEKNIGKINALIQYFKKIYHYIAIAVTIIGVLAVPFLNIIINLDEQIDYIEIYYLLYLMQTVISYLFVYRTTLITANQKGYILNKYGIFFQLFSFIVKNTILVLSNNFALYLLFGNLCSILENLFYNHITYKMYPYLKKNAEKLDSKERNTIYENVKALFLYKICNVALDNTDNILISIFSGTILVGLYSNYSMIIVGVTSIITLIFNGLKASIGNYMVQIANKEARYRLFRALELATFWIVGFCFIMLNLLIQDFIKISFGEKYLLDNIVVFVALMNFYSSNIRQSVWAYRETLGVFVKTKYFTAITALLNVILSIIMGYFWGMFGIFLATFISRMAYAFWKEAKLLYEDYFEQNVLEYFLRHFFQILLCLVLSIGLNIVFSNIFIKNIYLEFLIYIVIGTVGVNIIFIAAFYRTKEFQYIKDKLINIIKK